MRTPIVFLLRVMLTSIPSALPLQAVDRQDVMIDRERATAFFLWIPQRLLCWVTCGNVNRKWGENRKEMSDGPLNRGKGSCAGSKNGEGRFGEFGRRPTGCKIKHLPAIITNASLCWLRGRVKVVQGRFESCELHNSCGSVTALPKNSSFIHARKRGFGDLLPFHSSDLRQELPAQPQTCW